MNINCTKNTENDYDVTIELEEEEKEDVGDAAIEMGLALFQITAEFLHGWTTEKEHADLLKDVVVRIFIDALKEYLSDGSFEKEASFREEEKLYSYMEEVYDEWLDYAGITEDELIAIYAGSTLQIVPRIEKDSITITIGDEASREILTEFPIIDIDEEERFSKHCQVAYMVATIIGDKVCGSKNNPIRKLPVGNADGGIEDMIRRAKEKSK